jgi:hypothetical protein
MSAASSTPWSVYTLDANVGDQAYGPLASLGVLLPSPAPLPMSEQLVISGAVAEGRLHDAASTLLQGEWSARLVVHFAAILRTNHMFFRSHEGLRVEQLGCHLTVERHEQIIETTHAYGRWPRKCGTSGLPLRLSAWCWPRRYATYTATSSTLGGPPLFRELQLGTTNNSKAMQSMEKAVSTAPHDRIYMYSLHHSRTTDGSILITIVGQSKDARIYHLRLGSTLYCSCEAFTRRPLSASGETFTRADDPDRVNHCKHLFWVKAVLYKIRMERSMLRRMGYTTWELDYIFTHTQFQLQLAPFAMLDAHARFATSTVAVRPVPSAGEICPFNFEPVLPAAPCAHCVAKCRSAFFHTECLGNYEAYCMKSAEVAKCPLCRSPLVAPGPTDVKPVVLAGKERLGCCLVAWLQ